jgi:hypothetical protein
MPPDPVDDVDAHLGSGEVEAIEDKGEARRGARLSITMENYLFLKGLRGFEWARSLLCAFLKLVFG